MWTRPVPLSSSPLVVADMDLTPYRLPEGRFAFHITARENAASIRKDGLQQSAVCNSDTETIAEAFESRGYSNAFPFDRSEVVYCHLDVTYGEKHVPFDWPGNDDIVVVIDLTVLSAPLYLANMTAASEFIDHHVAPSSAPTTETFDEAVRQYRTSVVQFDGTGAVPKRMRNIDGDPELIIDADVPVEAIVDIREPHRSSR